MSLYFIHCKYLNARFECNDIVIFIYSHYPLDLNAKLSDTKCFTLSIRWFCIRIERVMTVYWNYDVITFKSCIQIFTVYEKMRRFPICTLHTHIAWYVKRAWWQFSFLSADSESIISKEKAAGFASMEEFHYGKTECFRNLVHKYTFR